MLQASDDQPHEEFVVCLFSDGSHGTNDEEEEAEKEGKEGKEEVEVEVQRGHMVSKANAMSALLHRRGEQRREKDSNANCIARQDKRGDAASVCTGGTECTRGDDVQGELVLLARTYLVGVCACVPKPRTREATP